VAVGLLVAVERFDAGFAAVDADAFAHRLTARYGARAVLVGDDDRHAYVAQLQTARPMLNDNGVDIIAALRLIENTPQLQFGHRGVR